MTDSPRRAALLALEDRVSPEQYAAYRRRLDARLHALRRSPRRHALAAAALLLLSISALSSLLPDARIQAETPAVVLRHPKDFFGCAELHPYRLVTRAQVVAVVRVGATLHHDGETRVPLHVERVLKNETRAELPAFQCVFASPEPPKPQRPLLVYLTFAQPQGWKCADAVPLDEASGRTVVAGVERCADLLRAPDSPDARREYERLLSSERGGLDEAAHCALVCRPDGRSADTLLAQLQRLHEQLAPAPTADRVPDAAEQLLRLAEVLATLQESRAAVPLVEASRRVPREQRAPLYRLVPRLCQRAPEELRQRVRALLAEERNHPAAAAALDALNVPVR